jgi:hypothetical protein
MALMSLFIAPAVGFERPFEMLEACHERVCHSLYLFPRVLAGGDAALRATVQRLRADHLRMTRTWASLRPVPQAWAGASACDPVDASVCELVQPFQALYAGHMPIEEGLLFPAARALCDAQALAAMGGEMQGRRRAAARIAP